MYHSGLTCQLKGVAIMFSHVVVGVDGSPMTPRLLKSLRDLHGIGTRSIKLVWVVDFETVSSVSKIQDEYLRDLSFLAEEMIGYGFRVTYSAPVGSPALELVQCAKRENADLIVVGSHGRSVFEEMWLGSTAARVIRISPIPTLIERPLPTGEEDLSVSPGRFQRILLATDLSLQAEPATRVVKQLVEIHPGLEIVVALTVLEPNELRGDLAEAEEMKRVRVNNLLKDMWKLNADVETVAWVGRGRPVPHITRISEEYDITLIVLGTQGKGRFQDIILGSTAQGVATAAKRPVLLVPGDSDQGAQ